MRSSQEGILLKEKEFNILHSQMSKGIGVLLLFLHHILSRSYDYKSIIPLDILTQMVSLGKVCVGIFFVISGYGLYRSFWNRKRTIQDDLCFVVDHILKLLFSFWAVYLIFVPASTLFGIDFVEIYTRKGGFLVNFIADFFGMASIFATPSMNNTWWYLGASVIFYLVSPVFFRIIKKCTKFIYVLFLLIFMISWYYYGLRGLVVYFVPFFFGALIAEKNLFERIRMLYPKQEVIKQLLMLAVAVTTIYIRQIVLRSDIKQYKVDWILAFIIIYICYYYISIRSYVGRALIALGKQSGNIFFLHSFFYAMWFTDLIYGKLQWGGLIYAAFLLICYAVSVFLEKLKIKTGIRDFVKKFFAASAVKRRRFVFLLFLCVILASRIPAAIGYMTIGNISIETPEAPIGLGNSRRIKVDTDILCGNYITPRWESSNTEIVIVSYDGVITGVGKGTAEVYFELGRDRLKYTVIVE